MTLTHPDQAIADFANYSMQRRNEAMGMYPIPIQDIDNDNAKTLELMQEFGINVEDPEQVELVFRTLAFSHKFMQEMMEKHGPNPMFLFVTMGAMTSALLDRCQTLGVLRVS